MLTEAIGAVLFNDIVASASGNTAVVSAVEGMKIRVLGYTVVGAGAVNVKFKSGSTDLTGVLTIAGAGGGLTPGPSGLGHFETAKSEALNINLSDAVVVGGHLTYQLVKG